MDDGRRKSAHILSSKTKSEKVETVQVSTKTFSHHVFGLSDLAASDRKRLLDALLHYASPASFSLLFGLEHARALQELAAVPPGSDTHAALQAAFRRRVRRDLGAALQHTQEQRWVASDDGGQASNDVGEGTGGLDAGALWACCPSYPCVVPLLPGVNLKEAALLWSNGRFPVWSWTHRHTRATLLRAAQPSVCHSCHAY